MNHPVDVAGLTRRWRMGTVLTAVCATVLGAAVPTGATASGPTDPKAVGDGTAVGSGDVPGDFGTWNDLYAMQDRLNAAADTLYLPTRAGYAGLVVAPESREVVLYWKGTPPADVTGAVAEARIRVPVRVVAAPYSEAEMAAEAERWAASGQVVSASPRPDGSGVQVTVDRSTRRDQPRLPGASLPVQVVDSVGAPELHYSRQADHPPYWGGARIWTPDPCSVGFAATNLYGNPLLLTAAHCGTTFANVLDGRAVSMGWFGADFEAKDIGAVVLTSTPDAAIYTGAWNSSSARKVVKASRSYIGNWISSGGASSGEHGFIQVMSTGVSAYFPGHGTKSPLVAASNMMSACSSAKGDSGGPVYSYTGSGAVVARGTITGGMNAVYCPGVNPVGTSTLFYVDIMDALYWTGSTLKVST